MANPRSLVHALYIHWNIIEVLVRLSREYAVITSTQAMGCIGKASPQLDSEARGAALRALVQADILQPCARSSDLQLNAYVLEFVRGLTREHELGLAAVLQVRVAAIRDATGALNEGMPSGDMDRVRRAANDLASLFRQISLQLDQDRQALLELAESAKGADASVPIAQRYHRVLKAYEQYIEPMNQMMDTGPQGTFYRYLEDAERALDLAHDQLSVQGGLHSHRLQLRQVAHQAKELRRFGRLIAQQCADTLLPLREEMRQHNALASAVGLLLGTVRKRGLRRALSRSADGTAFPVWRNERSLRLHLGDEVRGVMAAARDYQAPSIAFPRDEPGGAPGLMEHVDAAGIRKHLERSLPVESLLDWLNAHHGHLQDATLLRLFHELQHESAWRINAGEHLDVTTLRAIRVLHHPHRVSLPS